MLEVVAEGTQNVVLGSAGGADFLLTQLIDALVGEELGDGHLATPLTGLQFDHLPVRMNHQLRFRPKERILAQGCFQLSTGGVPADDGVVRTEFGLAGGRRQLNAIR